VYFYIAKGNIKNFYLTQPSWDNNGFKIGVMDKNNKIIVPIKYDKIYNPNSIKKGTILVEKDKKLGLYGLDGKQNTKIIYNDIFPVNGDEVLCQFRKGSIYGWIDKQGKEYSWEYIGQYSELGKTPLDSKMVVSWNNYINKRVFLEIPDKNDNLYRIVFTPSYIFELEIAEEVFFFSKDQDEGVTDFDASVQQTKTLGQKIKAVVATIVESGMDPRDSYTDTSQQLILVNDKFEKTARIGFNSFKFYSDTLLEVVEGEQNYPFHSLPSWKFYKIESNGKVTKLKSNRFFAFTQFGVIDDNYFKIYSLRAASTQECNGQDTIYKPNIDVFYYEYYVSFEHLSIEDLDVIRNEIFATYGYKFKTKKWQNFFSKYSWYKFLYDNVDDKLSEIDKKKIEIILKEKQKMIGHEAEHLNKKLYAEEVSMAG